MRMKYGRESKVPGNQMWQGIKCGVVFIAPSLVIHVGWPRMSQTVTVAFPARVLRWGYLSQGKGSISSKLQSFFLPSHQKNERKHLELHVVVSNRHGLPLGPPLILTRGYEDVHEHFSWSYCELCQTSLPSPWSPSSCIDSSTARKRPSRS